MKDSAAPERDPTLEDRQRVFVSYSRRDFYFAEQLAVELGRRGLAVWFDVHELAAGTELFPAIDRGIVQCDGFVLVAPRGALESSYVERSATAPPGSAGHKSQSWRSRWRLRRSRSRPTT
jgi:hypothetical protein